MYFCRSIIGSLRKQLDADGKEATKLKIEKHDFQTQADMAKSSADTLAHQLKTVEARCQTYKVLNMELTHKLEGTLQHFSHSMLQQRDRNSNVDKVSQQSQSRSVLNNTK